MSLDLLNYIKSRKDYIQFKYNPVNSKHEETIIDSKINEEGILILNGYQQFISNFMSFNEVNDRLLLVHSTGVGKTITSLSTAINQMKNIGGNVFILGFSKSVFKKELMGRPEFGYVNQEEVELIKIIKNNIAQYNKQEDKDKLREIKRRISFRFFRPIDKELKGKIIFIGYKMLASKIFIKLSSKISLEDLTTYESIDFYLKKKYIRLNQDFINQANYSFLICDEIHNLYSSKKMNSWGICLKYLIDTIKSKTLFLSATPVNNKPQKLVSVINLLSKGNMYKQSDLFLKDELTKEGNKIVKEVMTGHISYLIDKNKDLYPSKTFKGKEYDYIKYIKLVECEASEIHYNTIQKVYQENKIQSLETNIVGEELEVMDENKDIDDIEDIKEITKISNKIPLEGKFRMLNDIVIPSIDNDKEGIFLKEDIIRQYSGVSTQENSNINLTINKNTECVYDINGDFLSKENLKLYSAKYFKMLEILEDIISKGNGKTFIYHNYVQGSGTCLIKNILKKNGFVERGERITNFTRCSKCFKQKIDHSGAECEFKSLTFIYITGYSSKSELENLIDLFNSKSNINGWEINTIIGSQAIKESYDFKCIRNIIVAFLPDNISTLIQILGRAVRKNSHKDLDKKFRNVDIYLLITALRKNIAGDVEKSFEQSKYEYKTNMFSKIKKINKLFIENAIDLDINHKINYESDRNINIKTDTDLDSIPFINTTFSESDNFLDLDKINKFKFYSYYFSEEVKLCIYMIKRLFIEQSRFFTYSDILDSIRNPPFYTNRNCSLIDENSIISAIFILTNNNSNTDSNSESIRQLFSSEDNSIVKNNERFIIKKKNINKNTIYYLSSLDNTNNNIFQLKRPLKLESISINEFLNNDNNSKSSIHFFLKSIENINIESLDYIITEIEPSIHLSVIEDIIKYFNFLLLKKNNVKSQYHDIYIKLLFFYNKFNIIIFANKIDINTEKDYESKNLTNLIEKTNKELYTSSDSYYKEYQNYVNTVNATEDEYNLIVNGLKIKYHLYYKLKDLNLFEPSNYKGKNAKVKDYIIPIGHYFNTNIKILTADGKWVIKEKNQFNNLGELGKKFKDNKAIIGFLEKDKSGFKISFKIKLENSLDKNNKKPIKTDEIDYRKVILGSVCDNHDKDILINICKKLNIKTSDKDKKVNLCDYIKIKLIKLELEARKNNSNTRYFKFYWE